MHIAVDARNIKSAGAAEEQHTLALLYKLIQSHPEHYFTIISVETGLLPALPNATEHISTTVNSYLQLRRWYKKQLPEIVRQAKADVLISMNGAGEPPIPQIVFLSSPNAAEQHFANKFFSLLYKKYLARQIAKADIIATFTHLQQTVIAKHLNIKVDQIIPVGYAAPPVFTPVSWQQKEVVLQKNTNGNEYFLYTGSFTETTFLLVLKAFSLFKKRQLSGMQLIAAGTFTVGKDLAEKLVTYKYRNDVKIYESADQQTIATITCGAYAVINLNKNGLTAFEAAAALQCEIPVIGLENSAMQEVAESAGLYASLTPESLAEQMKLLYKDENLRKQLIVNASAQMPFVNGDNAVRKLWNCIDVAATKIRLHLPPENEPEI